MRPGQKIEIQLVDEVGRRVRLRNILVTLTLFMGGHLRYTFDLKPTSADGRTTIDFEELNTRRLQSGLICLMDYNTPLTDCDSKVEISVLSEAGLQQRLQAINQWDSWSRPSWTLKWPANGCLGPVPPEQVTLQETLTRVDLAVSLPAER